MLHLPKHRRLTVSEIHQLHPHLQPDELLEALRSFASTPGLTDVCSRCGSRDIAPFDCFRCHGPCRYCRSCLQMSVIRGCERLYYAELEPPVPSGRGRCTWDGTLSPSQQQAADALVRAWEDGRTEQLLWAVCGAGKTEMLFPLIGAVLDAGHPVLVTAPRRDVVQELAPRLKQAFPDAVTAALHGGLEPHERFLEADLYVATTHQAMRLYHSFPVVFIDEVDAFPYTADERLHRAVRTAARADALHVTVSATPSASDQRRVRKGALPAAVVPRRYHGQDLPVPTLVWAGNWAKRLARGMLPSVVTAFLQRHAERPVMLFVPEVVQLDDVERAVQAALPGQTTASVHAGEPERAARVAAFRSGEVDILLTTTILERGVTIYDVQVAVLGAEAEIFTETALVQIAGRAGRHPQAADGDVVFFHYGYRRAAAKAVAMIEKLNRRQA
ncbi:DEAD/DEAH box helicase [Alkalicoccus chagannorensis]|uniref:DEAD/DEAH box helicase n=1 Tax=Alkalicoccus chagannorensis TaxID=427072 RepID=UPI000418D124|nr:helicase-related protein [Alkalicoccus chagannorensis]